MFSSHRASTRLRGKRQQENEKKYISWLYEIKNFFHFFFLARLCEIRIMKSRLAREISSHTQNRTEGKSERDGFFASGTAEKEEDEADLHGGQPRHPGRGHHARDRLPAVRISPPPIILILKKIL
jgi:hypothetical protein